VATTARFCWPNAATSPPPFARHVVAPDGIRSTEWPSVRDTCHRLGWGFDGWQHGAGKLILSKRSDDTYAADTTCISIPRQAGKTYLIACIIFALCLLKPGLTVIWTAHRKSTARETFDQFDGMAKRPKVAAHIRQVLRGKGDEQILFNNGSRILFGARESGFGRGFAGVDILVCDEGQILPESTLEDLAATQNTAPNPLFFVMGTPPRPRDAGEFFTLLRQEALDGESESTLYIETSADRGTDPMNPDQLRKANPSYPHRSTHRAMLRLRKKLRSDEAWNREARGIWDEFSKQSTCLTRADLASARAGWRMTQRTSRKSGPAWTSQPRSTGSRRAGRRLPVLIDAMSPAASMIPALKARGVKVLSGSADMSRGCGLIASDVEAGRLTHADQESVNEAREGARRVQSAQLAAGGMTASDPATNIAPTRGS
jgi:hypothetical protein